MKYWESIADKLAREGWSYGYVSFYTGTGQKMFCVDAHREGGPRLVIHGDSLLAAFREMEAQCMAPVSE